MGLDSVVRIETGYTLEITDIERPWGRDFPHPSRPGLGPTQHPAKGVLGHFPAVKGPKRGVNHATTPRVEAKGRAQLHHYPRLDLNGLF